MVHSRIGVPPFLRCLQIDRSEAEPGPPCVDAVAARTDPPPPKPLPPHLRAVTDEVIFGRDTDGSSAQPTLTQSLAAAFDGAAGLDTDAVARLNQPLLSAALGDSPCYRAPLPHVVSTADALVYGDGRACHPTVDAGATAPSATPGVDTCRAGGAAGQLTPRVAGGATVAGSWLGDDGAPRSYRKPVPPAMAPACAAAESEARGDTGTGTGGGAMPSVGRASRPASHRAHVKPAAITDTVTSRRAQIGPSPMPSPVFGASSWFAHDPSASISSMPASRPETAPPSSSRGVASGFKVLRPSQPPTPSSRPAATPAHVVALSTPRTAQTAAPTRTRQVDTAAGRPSARLPGRPISATPQPACEAAGRASCTLTARERKIGHIALMGGLG